MRRITVHGLLMALLVGALFSFGSVPARSQDGPPAVAPALRGPDDYEPADLELSTAAVEEEVGDGLKAVAVVGDVGTVTARYRDEMDQAVNLLRNRGASVETFYYGERSFSWSQVVTALTGAHVLLYIGHGVYWGGACTQPDLVGGFYLHPEKDGVSGYVHPDQIRNDLAGRMAEGAVVILSHACYAAGDATCPDQPSDWPSQAEAERHVEMYAAPFVDIGVEAYFANNYYGSTTDFVDRLLAEDPMTLGDVFKRVSPYDASEFRDLSYPKTGYDLWLSGTTGSWDHAFVGIPDHVFNQPQLGLLPDALEFLYFTGDGSFLPSIHTVTPENVSSSHTLSWEVTAEGDWFVVTPSSGETSTASTTETGSFAIEPLEAEAIGAASTTGTVTVLVTNPDGTIDGEQTVAVSLETRSGSPSRVYLPLVTSD